MKTVNVAWTIFFICIASIFLGASMANAENKKDETKKEPPEAVQDYVQCTYKQSASDEVIKYCGTLKGSGSISIRICGTNYTVDIICI